MPYHYSFDIRSNVVIQKAVGEIADSHLIAELSRATPPPRTGVRPRDPDRPRAVRHELSLLCDYRNARTEHLTPEGIREGIAAARSGEYRSLPKRWAIVAPRDLAYAQSRMFSVLAESLPIDALVFRDIDAARAWLGMPPESEDAFVPEFEPPIPPSDDSRDHDDPPHWKESG